MSHTENYWGCSEQFDKDIKIAELKKTIETLQGIIFKLMDHIKEQEDGVRE